MNQFILWAIAAFVIIIGFMFFGRQLKAVGRFLLRSAVGAAAMLGVNLALAPMGLGVGVNLLTAFVVGVLGIPGFVSLYILKAFL